MCKKSEIFGITYEMIEWKKKWLNLINRPLFSIQTSSWITRSSYLCKAMDFQAFQSMIYRMRRRESERVEKRVRDEVSAPSFRIDLLTSRRRRSSSLQTHSLALSLSLYLFYFLHDCSIPQNFRQSVPRTCKPLAMVAEKLSTFPKKIIRKEETKRLPQ